MVDHVAALQLTAAQGEDVALAFHSLTGLNFRAALGPLCRLLLTMEPTDPERAVLLACLALTYVEVGRDDAARRALRDAEARATTPRGREAARLVRARLEQSEVLP